MPGYSTTIMFTIRPASAWSCSRQRAGSVGSVSMLPTAASKTRSQSSSRLAT